MEGPHQPSPIPNADNAVIDSMKLRDYLLSLSHPVGKYKAVFFLGMGYRPSSWERLERDLREQHLTHPARVGPLTKFGQTFEIVGDLKGPFGKIRCVKSIWIILHQEDNPRFVTAYPAKT